MRDKDAILLEQIMTEMSRNIHYTKRLPTDVETRTSRAASREDQEKRVIAAQLKLTKLFKNLEANPDDLDSAREIYNLIEDTMGADFGAYLETEDDSEGSVPGEIKRTEFIINGTDELTWEEVLQKVLNDTKTNVHDYTKLLTTDGKKGYTIDQFVYERIPLRDPNTGEELKDQDGNPLYAKKDIEKIKKFYHLYELILRKLQTEVTPRSRKEEPGYFEMVFYFANNGQPINTCIRVLPDGTVPKSFDKNKRFLRKKGWKPDFNPNKIKGKHIDEIKEIIKNDEAYEAFLAKYPPSEINDEGEEIPSKWAWLYKCGGQPPKGFLEEPVVKEESYKTFLEYWDKDMDDFENEDEEDLYNDEEECSCGEDDGEHCSCDE